MRKLTEKEISEIAASFQNAQYGWIFISVFAGIFPLVSRAYRWQMMLEPLGYKPKFMNSFFSITIGYLVNLAVPRLGEVTRCGVMNRYEKVPFPALLGTVFLERLIDVFFLFLLTFIVIATQYGLLSGFMAEKILTPLFSKFSGLQNNLVFLTIVISLLIMVSGLVFYFLKAKFQAIYTKLVGLFKGFAEGLITIRNIRNKGAFIFHSAFIWVMYIFMFYICFYAFPETTSLPFGAVLAAFVFCTFGIIAIPGGIGAYPVILMLTLELYGTSKTTGFAFGWLAWTSQTLVLLLVGIASLILIPYFNKIQVEKK
ncbi:MAG: hypothetical protein POELPBGB_01509 [Bacteroidia bacterium]|nr:hypothetical protein [Bacteroidia bacterium]